MKILTVSGSERADSANRKLLNALPVLHSNYEFTHFDQLHTLPLFTANIQDAAPFPEGVINWKKAISASDALVICTPEYIHNLPALLKNALEWITASGELANKKVLPITFTPAPPRGAKAMQSLLWSLQALDASIVAQLPLYQNRVRFGEDYSLLECESLELLREGIGLLKG